MDSHPVLSPTVLQQLANHAAALRRLIPELDRAAAAGFQTDAHRQRATDQLSRIQAIQDQYGRPIG